MSLIKLRYLLGLYLSLGYFLVVLNYDCPWDVFLYKEALHFISLTIVITAKNAYKIHLEGRKIPHQGDKRKEPITKISV